MKQLIAVLITVITITCSPLLYADASSLDNYSVNKQEVKQMLKMMQQQGVITSQQYQEAVRDLESKSDADLKQLKSQAAGMVKKNPSLMQNPFQGL